MKISELSTQSFLGGTNVPANSYVLINYAESAGATPVTKKVSVQELGNAIAKELNLPSITSDINGEITNFHVKSVSNGAYSNNEVTLPDFDVRDTYTVQYNGDDMNTVLVVADTENHLYTVNSSNRAMPITIGGGGGADVSVAMSIKSDPSGSPDTDVFFGLVDTYNGILYTASDSGALTPFMRKGVQPVVVYDSTAGAFGYYEDDSSEMIPLSSFDPTTYLDTIYSGTITFIDPNNTLYTVNNEGLSTLGMPLFYDTDASGHLLLEDATGNVLGKVALISQA